MLMGRWSKPLQICPILRISIGGCNHSVQVTTKDNEGNEVSKTINFSMNIDWTDPTPTPSPT